MKTRPRATVWPLPCLAVAMLTASCGGHGSGDLGDLWPSGVTPASWQADVGVVKPVTIVSVSGDVTGASALVNGGSVTLTRAAGGAAPTIVLDYGRDVGGLPTFTVTQQTGAPTLSATFSESLANVASGDTTGGLTVSADPARTSLYPVAAAGTITSQVVQGGERYEVISLATVGSVTLSAAGIASLARAPTSTVTGSFMSSSDTLNRIWAAGAYTVELDRLAAGALPLAWTPTSEGTVIGTSSIGIVQKSAAWGPDYTMTFDIRVDRNSGGWAMRDFNNLSTLEFILHGADDTLGTPDTLEFAANSTFAGGKVTFATLALPASVATGSWHTVRTTMSGATIVVTLDGTAIGTLDADALGASALLLAPIGSAGFFNATGNQATYRNLSITDTGGTVLYANALTTTAALDDFAANTNALPLLIDGGKRDRTVWSGDIAVEGPTLFYSSFQTDAVAGSLQLLGSYVRSSGEIGTTVSPQQAVIADSADSYVSSNFYSAQYSLYFVTMLYDYYLHTGDATVLAQQWSKVQGELAYMRTLVDGNGLVSVSASDAQDWLPNFASPTAGEVTSTNLLYYRALVQAAALAKVADTATASDTYAAQAAALKTAINATLYNPSASIYGMSASLPAALAQDANSLAILTGVAPADRAATLLARIASGLASDYGRLAFSPDSGRATVISPFASDLEVRARLESGDTTGALSLVKTLWGNMLGAGGYDTGTTWEAVGADGAPPSAQTSLAHGWSSGPTSSLSRYVLGIRPVGAGYAQWLVKPQTGDLSWAIGQAPTPHGALGVKWGVAGSGFSMEVTVPAGTTGTIAVPVASASSEVRLNGKATATAASSTLDTSRVTTSDGKSYRYIDGVGPGTWRISVPSN